MLKYTQLQGGLAHLALGGAKCDSNKTPVLGWLDLPRAIVPQGRITIPQLVLQKKKMRERPRRTTQKHQGPRAQGGRGSDHAPAFRSQHWRNRLGLSLTLVSVCCVINLSPHPTPHHHDGPPAATRSGPRIITVQYSPHGGTGNPSRCALRNLTCSHTCSP